MSKGDKFKILAERDGTEWYFDHKALNTIFDRYYADVKTKNPKVTKKDVMQEFADMNNVTVDAVKKWLSGKNGVADIERIKEMSKFFDIKDYWDLLKPRTELNTTGITYYQWTAARRLYMEFMACIHLFSQSTGFTDFSYVEEADSTEDVNYMKNQIHTDIRCAMFDLPQETCIKLKNLLFSIGNFTPPGNRLSYDDIFRSEEFESHEQIYRSKISDANFRKDLFVFHLKERYSNELYEILKNFTDSEAAGRFAEEAHMRSIRENQMELCYSGHNTNSRNENIRIRENNRMEKINYETPTFAEFDLEEEYNFIEAPKCGCGHEEVGALALLDTDEQLASFMGGLVYDNECERCAIFAKKLDGRMHVAVKCDGNIQFLSSKKNNKEDFKRMAEMLHLHQYGLIVEVLAGHWHIVEK